jgi:hypothetical protein
MALRDTAQLRIRPLNPRIRQPSYAKEKTGKSDMAYVSRRAHPISGQHLKRFCLFAATMKSSRKTEILPNYINRLRE